MDTDLYQALGVNRGAPPEVIRSAYRKAAKECHPDAGGTPEKWALVCLAHDTLTDKRRREEYDQTGSTDDLEAAAMQTVYDTVAMVVATIVAGRRKVETFDIVSDAIKTLQMQIGNINNSARQQREANAALEQVVGRFKARSKGKPNDLQRILGPQFQGHLRAAKAHETQRQVCEMAIAILREHRFEAEAEPWW
jgi:DnaJ-class molecular chaperone